MELSVCPFVHKSMAAYCSTDIHDNKPDNSAWSTKNCNKILHKYLHTYIHTFKYETENAITAIHTNNIQSVAPDIALQHVFGN